MSGLPSVQAPGEQITSLKGQDYLRDPGSGGIQSTKAAPCGRAFFMSGLPSVQAPGEQITSLKGQDYLRDPGSGGIQTTKAAPCGRAFFMSGLPSVQAPGRPDMKKAADFVGSLCCLSG